MQRCQQEFYGREQQNVASHLPGDTYSNLHLGTRFSQVNSDLILLPVYLLSYKYRDKLYRFMVNGQTGKVAGDKPLSVWRIVLPIGVAVVVVLIVLLLMLLGGAAH